MHLLRRSPRQIALSDVDGVELDTRAIQRVERDTSVVGQLTAGTRVGMPSEESRIVLVVGEESIPLTDERTRHSEALEWTGRFAYSCARKGGCPCRSAALAERTRQGSQRCPMRRAPWVVFLCACGGTAAGAPDAGDAGAIDAKHIHKPVDASPPPVEASTEWDRMEPHEGIVIGWIHLLAVYITSGGDAPKNFDALLAWMVASTDYWSTLAQYNVGYGTFEGSVTLDASTFFQSDDLQSGGVSTWIIGSRLEQAIATLPSDAGAANAYIVFLPGPIQLAGDVQCSWAYGFHAATSTTPYAVIPACGATGTTVSHKIAEMATDPIPFAGWYSEADEQPAGGEVGDLCNFPTSVDGKDVTALWSNAAGQCEPL